MKTKTLRSLFSFNFFFIIFVIAACLYISSLFKYYSSYYNHADSAVYNQVINSILFRGETGSSLEIGGEKSTFNIHFSPFFYLLAPFKLFFFTEFSLEIIQTIIILLTYIFILFFYRKSGCKFNLIFAGIIIMPQIMGVCFTSFRTVKFSLPFCIAAYCSYKQKRFKTFFLFIILLLSLIETNISIVSGFLLLTLSGKNKNFFHSFVLLCLILLSLMFSFFFTDFSRHCNMFGISISDFIYGLIYFSPLLVLLCLTRDYELFVIILPAVLSIVFGSVPNFFNFSNRNFLPLINCYYSLPVFSFLIILLLKKSKIIYCDVYKKKIYLLPIIFIIFSFVYGFDEKKILFNFITFKNTHDLSAVNEVKKLVPADERINTSYHYTDIFSEYKNLYFFKPINYSDLEKGNLSNNYGYNFTDLSSILITENSTADFNKGCKTGKNHIISLLESSPKIKILYLKDNYILFRVINYN